jgi:hypothetical protein
MKQAFIVGFIMPFIIPVFMAGLIAVFAFIGGPIAFIFNLEGVIPNAAIYVLAFLWLGIYGGFIGVMLAAWSHGGEV